MRSRNCLPFRSIWAHPGFSGVCVARSFVFYISLGRWLFDFCLPLYCLSVFDLLLPITPLVSSNLKDTGTIKRHWHHLGTPDTERRQRDNQETLTSVGYTRHRTKRHGQSKMDTQEILTPFGYTSHRTKTKMQSII